MCSPMSRPGFAFLMSVVLAASTACGPGILSPDTAPPPLFHLEVDATNAVVIEGDVRAALAWSVYSDELVACLDPLEVDGLIVPENFDDPFDPAIALIRQMSSCLQFSERGHVETDSVAVEAEFPASFAIPVDALPDPSLLSGSEGARLGLGDVLVYVDGDNDQTFNETPLGAASFIDRVVGTSRAYREEDYDESLLVYREGELSSVWKFYRGIYGCDDPPLGFSTVTLRFLDDEPYVECVINDAPVTVELDQSGAIDGLACAADPDRYTYTRPGDQGLPADAVGECVEGGDGWFDVVYTTDVNSVCPDVGQYNLVGCSDLTSQEACRATYWDMVGNEPTWWPCTFGNGEQLFIAASDDETPASSGVDTLFTLTWTTGFGGYAPDRITVAAIVDGEGTEVALALGDLADRDGNGAFNAGDELIVTEPQDQPGLFDGGTIPGNYEIVLRVDGAVLEAGGYRYFQPVPVPQLVGVAVSAADAPAAVTTGADDLFAVTFDEAGNGATSYALADVEVNCYVGGEYPVLFSLRDDDFIEGTLFLSNDENGDGRFGVGDSLVTRERENVTSVLDPEGLATWSHDLYCGVSFDVGFNAVVYAASFFLVIDPVAGE